MGVEFFSCAVCGESVCDSGPYERCECGRKWCGKRICLDTDGFENDDFRSCKFCRDEDVEDVRLLEYCLGRLGMTREQAIGDYLKG
jgi:hypothetical protein